MLGQAAAFDQFHAEVVLVLMLADLVDGYDIGVIEVSGGLGLGLETPHVGFRGQLAGQDHLEGHQPLQLDLPGLVHHAHAAAPISSSNSYSPK